MKDLQNESTAFTLRDGFGPEHRDMAVGLFWAAFEHKLGRVMRPEAKALAFLDSVADPAHAVSAIDADGALIGVAGFKTAKGAFIGGALKELQAAYGAFGGLWRGLALSIIERDLAPNLLLMDGIVVSEAARGRGVGGALLDAVKAKATQLGCKAVRLDVIDSNQRARALYERAGFRARRSADFGPLGALFGFRRATAMTCPLTSRAGR